MRVELPPRLGQHGEKNGKLLYSLSGRAAFAYSEWQDQNETHAYYVYASKVTGLSLSRIMPPSMRMWEKTADFSPSNQRQMVQAIETQAELTREYLRRLSRADVIPLYRAVLKRDRADRKTGLVRAFRDTSPSRVIFSGTFSERISRGLGKDVRPSQVPIKLVFDSWLTDPFAFTPADDAGPPKMEYEVRYLRNVTAESDQLRI